uniref:Zinc finger protein-like 1 homolog n=1 Tax=Caligus clemensi TaxID=344056 RepID=C1C0V1_CALCM|nr:Zinc finger protein-like 1 [Caligus clemensi]
MGLCKCPRRNMTNQFCYEHRVNVCENCMVDNHKKCVVQSYLQWLQDSDYSPRCEFCSLHLTDQPCVRLVCYHVYHWACLDKYARSLPPDTAPAGYLCQLCSESIFPPDNLVSPVADELRRTLSDVNWARAGLGMKLLDNDSEIRPKIGPRPSPEGECLQTRSSAMESTLIHYLHHSQLSPGRTASPSTVIRVANDPDENKYKRRSPLEVLHRWLRGFFPYARRRSWGRNKCLIYFFLFLFGVISIIFLFSVISGDRNASDIPLFDPMNNPEIRVGEH